MFRIVPGLSDGALSQARSLFREYAAMPGVAPCLEDFEREVGSLPGQYAPPAGRILLAIQGGSGSTEDAIGCVALRGLDRDACEMKRLYVRPAFRGVGAGRDLVQALIADARLAGYERMLLDTMPSMAEAHKLYRALGFSEVSAYRKDHIPGALFFALALH